MENAIFKRSIPVLIHVLAWTVFGVFVFILSPLSAGFERPIAYWHKQLLMFSILLFAFYFNYFYLIPRLLFKNKIGIFLIINLLAGAAYVAFLILYDDYTKLPELMFKAYRPGQTYVPRPRNYYWDISSLLIFYVSVGISTSTRVIQKYQRDEKIKLKEEQEKTNAELSYLKAQINPHFFFNTLNNIYALTNLDVEKAKEALLKLSRMMRYVLYETEKNTTLLSKEIEFIKDYLQLMGMRLSNKVKVITTMPEKISENQIAPMLLLPFIENCFKHGISSQHESSIIIRIEANENKLKLFTQNTILKASESTPEGRESGIGLNNTMRRLELLYPGRYRLHIDQENRENQYIVQLDITLS